MQKLSWKDILVRIYSKLTWKSCYTATAKQNGYKTKLGKTIYGDYNDIGGYAKKQNRIHKVFKYMFFVPLVYIGIKILGKYLYKTVPNEPQYRELILFNRAFNNAVEDWHRYFLYNTYNPKLSLTEFMSDYKDRDLYKLLDFMRCIYITMCCNDTAYMELHNMLMFNITKQINNTSDGTELTHLLYTSKNVNDVRYMYLKDKLETGKKDIDNGKKEKEQNTA